MNHSRISLLTAVLVLFLLLLSGCSLKSAEAVDVSISAPVAGSEETACAATDEGRGLDADADAPGKVWIAMNLNDTCTVVNAENERIELDSGMCDGTMEISDEHVAMDWDSSPIIHLQVPYSEYFAVTFSSTKALFYVVWEDHFQKMEGTGFQTIRVTENSFRIEGTDMDYELRIMVQNNDEEEMLVDGSGAAFFDYSYEDGNITMLSDTQYYYRLCATYDEATIVGGTAQENESVVVTPGTYPAAGGENP